MNDKSSLSPDITQNLRDRKHRCKQRLDSESSGYTYFAIIGAKTNETYAPIGDIGFIRPVHDSPNVFELAAALKNKSMISAVERYTSLISHEMAVKNHPEDSGITTAVAWSAVAALRIRTQADFLVPAVSNYSWSTIAAVDQGTCLISLLEDVPHARRIGEQKLIVSNDYLWVGQYFQKFISLHNEAGFRLAADSFNTHLHHANLRMSTAALWSGIESLFAVNLELKYRISTLIATILEPRSETRLALYHRLKKLYDFRSKAVHGAEVSDEELAAHVIEVRNILSRLLVRAIEIGRVPTTNELERDLFSDS